VDFSVSFLLVIYVSDWSGKSVYHASTQSWLLRRLGVIAAVCMWPAVASHVCVRCTRLTVCLLTYLVYRTGYGVWITWLFIGFPCSTVLFLFLFFFHFQFSKSFSSSVIFSSLLLYTPIYPIISLFLDESVSLSSFFQFFVFINFLFLCTGLNWQVLSVFLSAISVSYSIV